MMFSQLTGRVLAGVTAALMVGVPAMAEDTMPVEPPGMTPAAMGSQAAANPSAAPVSESPSAAPGANAADPKSATPEKPVGLNAPEAEKAPNKPMGLFGQRKSPANKAQTPPASPIPANE